jgi:hypothetical protein
MSGTLAIARAHRLLGMVVATALILASAMFPSRTLAGTIAVVSCKTPGGSPAPIEGWEEGWTGAPFSDAGDNNECASGGSLASYVGDSVPQPGSSGPYWQYAPPAGDKIVGGQVSGSFSVAPGANNYSGAAGLLGPKFLFDNADVIGGDAGGIAGTFEGTYSLANHTGGDLWIYAFCEPPGATCPAGGSSQWYWAVAFINSAIIVLSNNVSPTGSSFGGPIAGSSPVSGTQNLTFQAADQGSGVYQTKVTLDGQTIYDATPDTNGGACVPLGSYQGAMEFVSAQPCKRAESVSIPINTTAFADGAHELQVTTIDAAGNQSVVYDGTLTSDNAPTVTSPPSISGTAQVGSTLSATNAVFAPRTGLGPLGAVSGQWLRCSGSGTGCSTIPGATAATYTPVASDDGYTIEYQNSVEDAYKHKAIAASAPTVAVTDAPGSGGSCVSTGCQSGTGGAGGSGGNGAGGGNGASGPGGVGGSGGSGSGVTINLGGSSGSVLLGSTTHWSVSLRISPHRVRRHTNLKLAGSVSTSPRPTEGKLVYLRARSVGVIFKGRGSHRHRVTVFGKWVTFQAFRAKSNGSFASTYKFKLGGKHTYQFQAVAPAEGQFRNPTGTSSTITVKEI